MTSTVVVDKTLYRTNVVEVGHFKLGPDNDLWRTENQINGGPLIVFPRTTVMITHEGQDPVVSTPNNVMLYNPDQVFRRSLVTDCGDECIWVWMRPDVLNEIGRQFDPSIVDREVPFVESHAPCSSPAYLMQRMLTDRLGHGLIDDLYFDETMFEAIREVMCAASSVHRPRLREDTQRAHVELVNETKALLSRAFPSSPSLASLARSLHTSPYHLCRVFKQRTGNTIHSFVTQMRLRASLEMLNSNISITQIALALGFSSHAHFTDTFRRAFGVTPSAFRRPNRARS